MRQKKKIKKLSNTRNILNRTSKVNFRLSYAKRAATGR
ncbi:Uncharacterised protein [Enterobacter hormaechei]|uniref:Uncharacterized protein n=1 Tax=Enterobacter hormaechei TaxID=158836 RepID=A0A822WQ22_9ENTR|nr:Uncharacterised protein [Enterobacter hormaechei]CZX43284.1 Uncharacterised protein [Enterobacter hormaechei]SAG33076.1 Uncharacterised protein [Enterobacter hormaechei]VAE94045.1 Uncharacterised protein [Enterobacter hormaechei]